MGRRSDCSSSSFSAQARSEDAPLPENALNVAQEGEVEKSFTQEGPSRTLEADRRSALKISIQKHLSNLAPLLLEFMQDRDRNKIEGPSRTALFVLNKALFESAVSAEKSFFPNQTDQDSWESVVRRVCALRKDAQDQFAKEVTSQQIFDKTTAEEQKLQADFDKRRRNILERREQAWTDVERSQKSRKIEPLVSFSCTVCRKAFDSSSDTGASSLCGTCTDFADMM